MAVDSYRYLPRSFREGFEGFPVQETEVVQAELDRDLSRARVAVLTSAGLFLKDSQEPFDVETEIKNPTWGDPTYREIPRDVRQEHIGAEHLHLNTRDFFVDFNVALPIDRLKELETEGVIGSLADINYSFMGFQEDGTPDWKEKYGPQLVGSLKQQGVNALILAPA